MFVPCVIKTEEKKRENYNRYKLIFCQTFIKYMNASVPLEKDITLIYANSEEQAMLLNNYGYLFAYHELVYKYMYICRNN